MKGLIVCIFVLFVRIGSPEHIRPPPPPEVEENLKGDPEDLTPLHPSYWIYTPPRPSTPPPPPRPKEWETYKYEPTKGETGDLATAGTRQRPRHQSYNRHYNPRPKHYSHQTGHQDGKKTKGGYKSSQSYKGSQGYASEGSFDRANKGDYGDSDHQSYNHKDGGRTGGSYGGNGRRRSYGNYGGEYGDDGNAYTRPEY